jgi:hypothetical protein
MIGSVIKFDYFTVSASLWRNITRLEFTISVTRHAVAHEPRGYATPIGNAAIWIQRTRKGTMECFTCFSIARRFEELFQEPKNQR